MNDIVDAPEMQFDESPSFLDRDTGQVVTVSHVLLGEATARSGSSYMAETGMGDCQRIVSTDRDQKLPTKFGVHEWAIMQDFSRSVESERIREDLLHAIHGTGAFRNFKETLRWHRIQSAWFGFCAKALRQSRFARSAN